LDEYDFIPDNIPFTYIPGERN